MYQAISNIKFVGFEHVEPDRFLAVVNEDMIRKHLIEHPLFNSVSIKEWMDGKVKTDSLSGCRIRAVYIDGVLAGWCGIQPDDNGVELAIVISQAFWGAGISIFKTLINWANELGHK